MRVEATSHESNQLNPGGGGSLESRRFVSSFLQFVTPAMSSAFEYFSWYRTIQLEVHLKTRHIPHCLQSYMAHSKNENAKPLSLAKSKYEKPLLRMSYLMIP